MTHNVNAWSSSPGKEPSSIKDQGILSIIATYILVGGLWILFSDRLLYELVKDPEALTRLQTLKGWFFVLATAGMLYLLIQRNMEALHRSQEALRESEERFRSLTRDALDTSAVGMFILDSNFRVVWVNRALERFFGLQRKDVLCRDKRKLIQEKIKYIFEDPEEFAEKVLATYDDNTYIEDFECHVLPRDGIEERWLEHWSQPIHSGLYAGGRIEHYYDITERKRTEQMLRESEEKYRNVVEKSLVGVYIIQDYVFKYVNDTLARIFGYAREEIENRLGPLDLTMPEDHEKVKRNIEKRISGDERTIEYEINCRRKNGEKIIVNVLGGRAVYRGRPAIIGTLIDVTEKKKAEKELSALNLQLLNLIDVNREIVSTLDLDEVLQRICEAAVKSLGVKTSWIGLTEEGGGDVIPRASFGHEEYRRETLRSSGLVQSPGVKEALKKGLPNIHNRIDTDPGYRKWWKDARKLGYRSSAAMPLLSKGKVLGVLNVYSEKPDFFTENTIRILENFSYQAAIALENAKLYGEAERLREFNEKIVQTMKEGIVVEDDKGFITFMNLQAEKMLGYTMDELMGEHWSKIVSRRYLKKVEKETMTRPGGISSRYECEIVRKNGGIVPIINSATPLFEKGEFKGVLSIFTDISDQKKKEESLRKKLMKYRVDWGNIYYVAEVRVERGLDAFLDVVDMGYLGIVISRAKPEELAKKLGEKAPVLWLSEKAPGEYVPPSPADLVKKIEEILSERKVILFQGLEYLISKSGFNAAQKFLQDLNELVYTENALFILSFDSRTLNERQMALIQKEAYPLLLKREAEIPEKYMALLRYVYERNMVGVKPRHKDVCRHFGVTRNTARSRINYLTSRKLLRVVPHGRSKILEITDIGKEYL